MTTTDPPGFVKRPADDRLYAFDFAALLLSGAGLVTVTAATAERLRGPAGELTVGAAVIDGTSVRQRLAGGTAGSTHLWRVIATDDAGNVLDAAIQIEVLGP